MINLTSQSEACRQSMNQYNNELNFEWRHAGQFIANTVLILR
jgi:hypothetical protein